MKNKKLVWFFEKDADRYCEDLYTSLFIILFLPMILERNIGEQGVSRNGLRVGTFQ